MKKSNIIIVSSIAVLLGFAGIVGYSFMQEEGYKATLPDLEMVQIPTGTMELEVPVYSFVSTEYVKKKVKIDKPFKIGAYEVTIKQWNICYKDGGCRKKAAMRKGETENHPVTKVNWLNAYNFTKWLSHKSGQKFRLPTEEEWTYAAFMGKHYKAEFNEYDYNEIAISKPKISRIKGHYGKNAWGMNDVQGNVWEWTLNCWVSSIDKQSEIGDPNKLNDPKACGSRFLWGEERAHIPFFVNTTYNGGCATARPASNLGFRLLLEQG